MRVNIEGLSKAEVLAALYNASRPQGRGVSSDVSGIMELEEAQTILDGLPPHHLYVDYLNGRIIKVDLTSDTEFDSYLYDRDVGEGAAQEAIDDARKEKIEDGES